MKILYCILDSRFGGPHRLALTVAQRLRESGVGTLFLLGHKSNDPWRPQGFESVLCRRIQCFSRQRPVRSFLGFCGSLPGNLLRLRRLIRSRAIDVVHVDGVTNFVPALAAALARTPIVWHYNDHLPGPLRWVLLPLVTALAATVVVQGQGLRQQRTKAGSRLRGKTVVIPAGVDVGAFRPDDYDTQTKARLRQELGLPPDGPVIGTIGNLNRFKGHAYFLRAAGRIKQRVSNATFLVVGRRLDTDPGYWGQLQRLTAELGLERDVRYTGFRDDIPAVLSILDVFVLSSILESCPVVLLEAMAMRVPVVTTDVGAAREMVLDGRTGLVVPPRDAEALAGAVLALLAKPAAEVGTMVAAARNMVESRFGVDTIADAQRQVYESVTRRPAGHL
jgi:glycosyltransferase involved in cell wall biosynthesis